MGSPEILFILFLALLIFGPKKLPEIARQIAKVMNEFKRASNEFRSQIETEIAHLDHEEKQRQILPPAEPPRGAVAALSGVVLPPESPSYPEPDSVGKAPDA